MRTAPPHNRSTVRLRACALFFLSCLVSTTDGCGSGSGPASANPVDVAPTIKPKFAYTGNQGASISGYSVDPSIGVLTPLSGSPFPVGTSPVSVTNDPQNHFLIASDISADQLHVYAINSTTGALSEVSPSPYNTMIESETVIVDPSGTHVYLYRTGASDSYPGVSGNQIVAFNLSSTGILSAVQGSPFPVGAPGATFDSVRGMTIDAAGKFLYLKDSLHLYTFGIDAVTGGLTQLQSLPSEEFGGITLDPGGLYLYVAGTSSLSSYALNPTSGLLNLAKSTPMVEGNAYTIALSPSGSFAYTIENNNDLISYTVSNGVFVPVGTVYPGVYGQQIAVDPSGSFVYVPQACSNCPSGTYNVVHQFAIGNNGALTPLSPPTVASGVTPFGITVTSQ